MAGCERDVVHRMNEGYRAWGALKNVGIKAKKYLYIGVIVPINCVVRSRGMGKRSVERRKVIVLEMKCFRSLVGVSRMDRVRYEEVLKRAGKERDCGSGTDQRVLRWFGHVERMGVYCIARRVLMAEVSGGLVRGRPRLG